MNASMNDTHNLGERSMSKGFQSSDPVIYV